MSCCSSVGLATKSLRHAANLTLCLGDLRSRLGSFLSDQRESVAEQIHCGAQRVHVCGLCELADLVELRIFICAVQEFLPVGRRPVDLGVPVMADHSSLRST